MPSVGRVTEIWAVSHKSYDDAIRLAIERASDTLRGLTGAVVREHELLLSAGGGIDGHKVTLLVSFVLDEGGDTALPAVPNPATQTADFGD